MTRYIHGSEHALKFPLQEMAEKWRTQEDSNLWPLPSENTRTTLFSRFCSLFTVNNRGSKRESRVVACTVYATSPGRLSALWATQRHSCHGAS